MSYTMQQYNYNVSKMYFSQLTNNFLNVVDNIINIDEDILQESQESSNTLAK